MNKLRRIPKAKNSILESLRDLYKKFCDLDISVEGGAVQEFFTEGDFVIPFTRLPDVTLRYLRLPAILLNALVPVDDLEKRSRSDVQLALENATRNCGPNKAYRKGRRSFQVLAELNPGTLMRLPHFKRFIEAIDARLPERAGGIPQCRGT